MKLQSETQRTGSRNFQVTDYVGAPGGWETQRGYGSSITPPIWLALPLLSILPMSSPVSFAINV